MIGRYSDQYKSQYTEDRKVLERNVADHLLNMRPNMIELLPQALLAIDLANIQYWEELVSLPDGYTIRGRSSVPAGILVANLSLDKFVDLE